MQTRGQEHHPSPTKRQRSTSPRSGPAQDKAEAVADAAPEVQGQHPLVDQAPATVAEIAQREVAASKGVHRAYLLCVGALVHVRFNGNKCGPVGKYCSQRDAHIVGTANLSAATSEEDAVHVYDPLEPYLGHNIAAIAVRNGEIIAYACNRIESRNRLAHAEALLLDDLFSRSEAPHLNANGLLDNVDIYSSLEPCFMCAGKLMLSGARYIGYLQEDPDQVNALEALAKKRYSMHKDAIGIPLAGYAVDSTFSRFQNSYIEFLAGVQGDGNWTFFGAAMKKLSLPYYLCLDTAKKDFQSCYEELVKQKTVEGPTRVAQKFVRSIEERNKLKRS